MKKLYDKFVYNGIHSNDMHVLSVTFNNDLNEDFMAERTINETRTRENQTPYFQDIQHSPLEFELELFLGYDFEIDSISNNPLTDEEIRAVKVWLNQETYKPFYFEDAEDEIYMCMPISNTELTYNHIKQGYIKLRMRCNTYYKTTPSFQTYIYDCTSNENGTEIELENHGDLDCQPDIWIKKIGDGGISITNTNNKGQTLSFTKPENANGKLIFNGSLYDEELIKIGDKVYEVDTGDGIINSHIQRWESEMLYLEGIYVNVNGAIYKCIKSNTDKKFTSSNWEVVNESNIKVDCSLDSKQSKANLVFSDETIEDGETITIGDINYEFDLDDVYNASNGNIPINIKNYTSKATGILKCKSNDDFANSEIQISDKKYKILPTSTTSQIVIDDDLTSWDRFQLDYDWNDASKLNKICLLMNQKRDNTLNGIRLPYLNEEKNKNVQYNIYELYAISKLTDIPILGTADTGKFEPTLSAINNQQAGDKLTLFKRDARDITLDCGCSTKTKFVVAKAKNESTLAQGGIYNKNLRASEGDIILLAKKVDTGVESSKVTYNGKDYSKGQFELLRISAVEETNNGSLFASHEDGTLAYTLESSSSLFEQNKKFIHGNGKTVYGNSIDLENGRKYLQKYNYRFVNTERMKKEQQEQVISSGDILLGAITSAGGVVIDPSGTTRLGGKDRYETAEKIRQYALGIESQYSSYNYKFNIILFKKQDKQITLLNGTNNFTQPYQIKQGSTLEETCLNIEKAINETGVDWVNYSAGTFKNDDVDAKYNQSTNEIVLTATEYGADSNEFTTVVNDWNFSQKELSKGKLVNQFTNKTLTGGTNPTWNSVYNEVKLINVVKDVLNKEQGTDFNFSISTNKINIANRKYGTIGNLISVISNCNACEFKNTSGEFTVTLDGGQDPSIETCINKLVEVIATNNTDVNVEKDLTKKEIKITYKESGTKGNIPVDSTCLNAYWDCNKKLSGGENGLTNNEEICIFQETGEVISDTNRNVIDSFNFEELTLKYGVNRLIVKGSCYLQFNIRYKLL